MKKLLFYSFFLFFSCNVRDQYLYDFKFEKILGVKSWEDIEIQIPEDKTIRNGLAPYDPVEVYGGRLENPLQYIKQYPDSIVAIFDIKSSGCRSIGPRTRISNDTLLLDYKFLSNACKEDEIYRLKYVIKRGKAIKYIRFYNSLFKVSP